MKLLNKFFKEEEGLATMEIVLICVVLVGVALLFKKQIGNFVDGILEKVTDDSQWDPSSVGSGN